MIHPHTKLEFISPQKGYGVVATKRIPMGTITWVQDKLDIVISPNQREKLGPEYEEILETYTFRDSAGNHILCWDNGRFVNHSFNSNCMTTPYNFEIAIRDIEVGEELTDDYGYLNISEPFYALEEDSERKVVNPDDLLRYHEIWDEQLNHAFQDVSAVEQPLYRLLGSNTQKIVKQITSGEMEMASILNCYYEPKLQNNSSVKR